MGWALWGTSHPSPVPRLELDTLLAQTSPGDRAHLREERAGFGYQEDGCSHARGPRGGRDGGGLLLSQVPNGSSLNPIALCLVLLLQIRQSWKVRRW